MLDNKLYQLGLTDQKIEVGAEVTVRWTADGFNYNGQALVLSLCHSSVQVQLLHKVGSNGRYPIGKRLEFPRYSDTARWSPRNCVQAVVTNRQRL